MSQPPIRIECNVAQRLLPSQTGAIEFRVTRLVADTPGRVQVSVHSRTICPEEQQLDVIELQSPGDSSNLHCPLRSEWIASGLHTVSIMVRVGRGRQERSLRGTFLFRVWGGDEPPRAIEVNINNADLIQQADQGGQAGINEPSIHNEVNIGGADPLEHHAEPKWREIQLTFDHRAYTARGQTISEASMLVGEQGDRLLLISRGTLVIGRGTDPGHEADVVVWRLPRTEHNEARTKEISRRHLELRCGGDGILVHHLRIETAPIRLPLGADPQRLDLARAVELELTPLPRPSILPERWHDWAEKVHDDARYAAWEAQWRIGGCLVEWMRECGRRHRCVWIHTAAEIDDRGEPCAISGRPSVFALLALPHLAVVPSVDAYSGPVEAIDGRLLDGAHVLSGDGWEILVERFAQHLE